MIATLFNAAAPAGVSDREGDEVRAEAAAAAVVVAVAAPAATGPAFLFRNPNQEL